MTREFGDFLQELEARRHAEGNGMFAQTSQMLAISCNPSSCERVVRHLEACWLMMVEAVGEMSYVKMVAASMAGLVQIFHPEFVFGVVEV